MELKQKIGFHNKFKIDVIRDEKVIQEGFAENIVLDRMYDRLCALGNYRGKIHYGKGTGTLLATRTTLFNSLAYKDETNITAESVSENVVAITGKISIGLSESNGETITEVGVSESTSAINTHAMITDSEGNTISIIKTDLDIIEIYATIFIEIMAGGVLSSSEDIAILGATGTTYGDLGVYATQNWGSYIRNLSGINFMIGTDTKEIVEGLQEIRTGFGYMATQKKYDVATIADRTNKKTKFELRIPTGDLNSANRGVSSIIMNHGTSNHSALINLMEIYDGYDFVGKQIGIGDGTTTKFNIHRDATSVSVKVGGVSDTNITYQDYMKKISMIELFDFSSLSYDDRVSISLMANAENPVTIAGQLNVNSASENVIYESQIIPIKSGKGDLNDLDFTFVLSGDDRIYTKLGLYGSTDGTTFTPIVDDNQTSYMTGVFKKSVSHTGTLTHIQFFIELQGRYTYSTRLQSLYFENTAITETEACIIFDTAPANTEVITASYSVPYIPKDVNHVIDIELVLQWGEGSV